MMIEVMVTTVFLAIVTSLTFLVTTVGDPILRQVFGGTLVMTVLITVIAACYALMKVMKE